RGRAAGGARGARAGRALDLRHRLLAALPREPAARARPGRARVGRAGAGAAGSSAMAGPLEVLLCDNHLLVVVKPAGLPSVPDESGDESLLERAKEWVKQHFHKPGAVFLGVVQRLDRPVSGVLVFARTSKSAARLSEALRERLATKVYWALAEGEPREDSGELVQWLWKDEAKN